MSYAIYVFASLLHFHLMHCIISLLAHICLYTLDHTEPKLEESMEQAQAEDLTNLALDQGKP
jgi:ssRNA-specific RNase YbeY (16S rRNA maturation enzyme)